MQVLFWDNENNGVPSATSLGQCLEQLSGGALGEAFASVPDAGPEHVWTIAWCRATYERGECLTLNHSLPMFSQRQYNNPEMWKQHVAELEKTLNDKIDRVRRKLELVGDDSDDEIMHSYRDRLNQLERQKRCFGTFMGGGWLPVDVPCDGNCLLWSILRLKDGYHMKHISQSGKERVSALRSVAWLYLTYFRICSSNHESRT